MIVDPFDSAPTTAGRQGKTFHDGDLIRILLLHLGQECQFLTLVSALAEIEAAVDALPVEQKKKLLQFLESRVNGESEPKRPTNLAEFAGTLRLSEDPLPWQRRMRGEWEHGALGSRRVDGQPEG